MLYSSTRPSTRCSSRGVQRDRHQGLRFAPLERRRAVDARQQVDLAGDRPEVLRAAAVRPPARKNQIADHPLFQVVPATAEALRVERPLGRGIGDELGKRLLLQAGDRLGPRLLALGLLGRLERLVVVLPEPIGKAAVAGRDEFRLHRLDLLNYLPLQAAELDDVALGGHDRIGHQVFGHFAGEPFDHQDRRFRTRDDQVQVAHLQLVVRRKWHELAVDEPEANRSDRPLEGDRREPQGERRPVHRQHVAIHLAVAGQDKGLNLHLVRISVRKQGPDRPIDQPRGERLLESRPPLPLEKSPRKFARRSHALAIVAHQREKVDSRTRRAGDGGRQHNRLVATDQAASRRLLREFPSFKPECLVPDPFFNTYFQCSFLSSPAKRAFGRHADRTSA